MGGYVGFNQYKHIGGEIHYAYLQSNLSLKSGGSDASFSGMSHVVAYDVILKTTRNDGKVQLFAAVGGGMKVFRGTGKEAAYQPLSQYGYFTKTQALKPMADFGAGVKVGLTKKVFLRAEFRDYITAFPTQIITPPPGAKYGTLLHDIVPIGPYSASAIVSQDPLSSFRPALRDPLAAYGFLPAPAGARMSQMRAALICLLLPLRRAPPAKCQLTMSACNEAANTDVGIFIGRLEAIEPSLPRFLEPFPTGRPPGAQSRNTRARPERSSPPPASPSCATSYLKAFPDLPEEHRKRLTAATSTAELAELFYWILDHGKRVRLRVKTVFRGEDLEDDDDDDDDAGKTVEVQDCLRRLRLRLPTRRNLPRVCGQRRRVRRHDYRSACTRTRRLSDAYEDLAYLYFFKNFGDAASRLEGSVTTDLLYQSQLDLNASS